MSDVIGHARNAVQEFAAIRGNKRKLARAANVPEQTLTGIDRDDWNPKTETLAALYRAMESLKSEGQPSSPLGRVA